MSNVVNEKGEMLYHVQIVSMWVDDPIDIFIFAPERPDGSRIRQLVIEDVDLDSNDDDERKLINALVSDANVYTIYPY